MNAGQACGASTVFWPGVEDIDAECEKTAGHEPPHEGTGFEWTDEEMPTTYPGGGV